MKILFLSAFALTASLTAFSAQVSDRALLESKHTAMAFHLEGQTWFLDYWGLKGQTAEEAEALGYHPSICYDEIGRVKPWTYAVFGQECWVDNDVNKFGGLAVTHADGTLSLELVHGDAELLEEKGARHLVLALKDPAYPFFVTQHFRAFDDCDVIETWVEIRHEEPGDVRLGRMDSLALAMPLKDNQAHFYSLTGDWAAESQLTDAPVARGQQVSIGSRNVTRADWGANPAFMLSMGGAASETSGRVIGCALCWTGPFAMSVRHDLADTYELRAGVDSANGAYVLEPGRTLALPPVALVYSERGRGEVSRQFHRWARNHWMPHGRDLYPVLLNSWEGCYRDVREDTCIAMMDGAKEMGCEIFVVDDGWFGPGEYPEPIREDGSTQLGDWEPNRERLPHGLEWLSLEAKKRGLEFGIWVEPEMAGRKSHLLTAHPDWILRDPKRSLKLKDQSARLVLDILNPDVQDNLFTQLDTLYRSMPWLKQVKWDCNVNLMNPGSPSLGADRQGNLWYDYGAALDKLLTRQQRAWPNLMVQACASGGSHMDYGQLKFADEFWPSDDTDARERTYIQWGALQFYPACAMAAEVTAVPNHQTGRVTPLKFRFDVGFMGRLGFELDPRDLKPEELEFCSRSVADYKRVRDCIQQGDLYRLVSPYERDYAALMFVNEERTHASVTVLGLVRDMHRDYPAPLRLQGLEANRRYLVREINCDGERRHVRIEGKVLSGAALMNQGFYHTFDGDYDSFTLELTAVE